MSKNKKTKKRNIDLSVLPDIHLGTYGQPGKLQSARRLFEKQRHYHNP